MYDALIFADISSFFIRNFNLFTMMKKIMKDYHLSFMVDTLAILGM